MQLLLPVFRNMLQYPRQRLRPVLLRPPLRIWQIIVELLWNFVLNDKQNLFHLVKTLSNIPITNRLRNIHFVRNVFRSKASQKKKTLTNLNPFNRILNLKSETAIFWFEIKRSKAIDFSHNFVFFNFLTMSLFYISTNL